MIGERLLIGGFYLPTARFSRRSSLWLIIPVTSLFLSWVLSACGVSSLAPSISKGFKLLVFLLAPGCYLAVVLGKAKRLRLEEILALDLMISMAIGTFVSIYLCFYSPQITETEMVSGLFVVTALSGILLLPQLLNPDKLGKKVTFPKASKAMIGLLASFLVGFLLIMKVMPESFWPGWDPWLNTPVSGTILEEGLNPFELGDRYEGVVNVRLSGFYYSLAATQAFTGIDLYLINRFWGPFLAGMASVITYLVVRRLEGAGAGLSASFFLFLNPFFVKRFSMALRENFGFLSFLGVLLLLIVERRDFHRDRASRLCFSFVLSLFLAISLSVHSLVPVIVYGIVILEIIFWFFKTGRTPVELVSALFLSLFLAAPYLSSSILTYIWTIHNWFSLSLESFISVLTVAIVSVVLIFYSRRRMFKSSGRYARKVLLILGIVLLIGAVYSIVFPKDFPVLGSYNPHITLEMFGLSSLLLACLGLLTIFRSSVPTGIISLSLLLILIPNLTNMNVAFPLFRLVLYLSLVLSYGAAKLLKFIYDIHSKAKLRFSKSSLGKTFEIGNWRVSMIVCVMSLILVSPIMVQDFQSIQKQYSYYTKEEVESALNFTRLLKDGDIVIPQGGTYDLLIYAGIDLSKVIHNGRILQELYYVSTMQNLSEIIMSEYPNASRTHVFMIERKIGNENWPAPPPELLELWGEKHQFESIVFYSVPLPFKLKENELLDSPIGVKLPAGPQWIYTNLTGVDLSNGTLMTIRILNNATSKSFFVRISDVHENLTEKIVFTLQLGYGTYSIPLGNLKGVIDLSNPSTLTFCFSWYTNTEIELTIESVTELSKS